MARKYEIAVYVYGANSPSRVYPPTTKEAAEKHAEQLRRYANDHGFNHDIRVREAS